MEAALVLLVASIEGALDMNGAPSWQKLCEDEDWQASLSSGERARLWLGMQLYNGYTPDAVRHWSLADALGWLDEDGRHAFRDALDLMWGD